MEALAKYEKILPIKIDYLPVHLGAIIIKSGNKPPATLPQKEMNMKRDIEYANHFYGLKMKWPKDFELTIVKRGSTIPQRFLTAVGENEPKFLLPAARAFGSRVWESDEPIHTEKDVLEVAQKLKIPNYEKLLEESKTDAIKNLFKSRTDEAMKTGAYGIPWLILKQEGQKDKVFFGSDRFHYIFNELGLEFRK
uniref:DSBA-like thioredoxin domain-containing protein n=1 Tax=Panagrolaimus sp. JU765 TaxID=591449 RepID=A0AC34R4X6_9BILA